MRKELLTIIAVVLLISFACTGCRQNETGYHLNVINEEDETEYHGTYTIDSIHWETEESPFYIIPTWIDAHEGVGIRIINNSEYTIGYGNLFHIYALKDGEWEETFSKLYFSFDILYGVDPGKQENFDFLFQLRNHYLKPGHYKIGQNFFVFDKNNIEKCTTWILEVEFDIKQ